VGDADCNDKVAVCQNGDSRDMGTPQFDPTQWPQQRGIGDSNLKISIITPSFNQSEFLETTIQSVLSQNYQGLEYIIIDAGSTDGSVEIIKKYEKFLHYWTSEPDGGMYAGIVKGMAVATGDVLAWLNSDDLYLPSTLRTVSSIFSEFPEIEWLSSLRPGKIDEEGFILGFDSTLGFSRAAFLDGRYLPGTSIAGVEWIQQESTFWRRRLWDLVDVRRLSEFSLAGDFYLWSSFFRHSELYGVRHPLSVFRQQRLQKTNVARERYFSEARKCLEDERRAAGWRSDSRRDLILWLKLNRVPRLRGLLAQLFGYRGKSVVRERAQSEDWRWALQSHPFL
jgi:glycosyltransferase involved in cell wall biosynthesis